MQEEEEAASSPKVRITAGVKGESTIVVHTAVLLVRRFSILRTVYAFVMAILIIHDTLGQS